MVNIKEARIDSNAVSSDDQTHRFFLCRTRDK